MRIIKYNQEEEMKTYKHQNQRV